MWPFNVEMDFDQSIMRQQQSDQEMADFNVGSDLNLQ